MRSLLRNVSPMSFFRSVPHSDPPLAFGYSTEDLYTGSGWDFYSYGPPYTPMYGRSSTSMPQDSVSRESRYRKLFRSFSVSSATLGRDVH
jgi:hypothetical protein